MTHALDLMDRYRQLMATPLTPATLNDVGESISILHQTKWIRILLIRRVAVPNSALIEVELSLPQSAKDPAGEVMNLSIQGEALRKDAAMLLGEMIPQLQYMLRLKEGGFILDVIENNCMWIVSRRFNEMPKEELFQLLVPP